MTPQHGNLHFFINSALTLKFRFIIMLLCQIGGNTSQEWIGDHYLISHGKKRRKGGIVLQWIFSSTDSGKCTKKYSLQIEKRGNNSTTKCEIVIQELLPFLPLPPDTGTFRDTNCDGKKWIENEFFSALKESDDTRSPEFDSLQIAFAFSSSGFSDWWSAINAAFPSG